jgi:hypothetical protein
MYECSKSGAVRNKHTLKLRPVEASPRPGDPHVYVRLVLKDSEMQHGSNNQKRLALRNVVAHAWVPGFTLTAEGHPSSSLRVYHKNKNPTDCRAPKPPGSRRGAAGKRRMLLWPRNPLHGYAWIRSFCPGVHGHAWMYEKL